MKAVWSALFLFLYFSTCLSKVCESPTLVYESKALKSTIDQLIKTAEKAIGSLDEKKRKAIEEIIRSKKDTYSTGELKDQLLKLRKAGFTKDEIATLQKREIIPNSSLVLNPGVPTSIAVREVQTEAFSSKTISELKNGAEVPYLIDNSGKIRHLVSGDSFESKTLWYAKEKASDQAGLIKEAGILKYDKATKQFVFKPKYSVDLAHVERKEILDQAHAILKSNQVRLLDDVRMMGSKTIDCLDILSAQSNGKNFILDRLISDNAVLTSAILTSELLGAGRLSSEQGRQVVAADLVGTNLSVFINGTLGKNLVLNNAGFLTSLGTRTMTAMGMIELQRNVYNVMLDTNSEERASNIANFDRAHFAGRLFINHYFDKFLVNKLPDLVFNACQRDSKSKIFLSPRAVRIYERFGSAMLYYGLRKAVVGE